MLLYYLGLLYPLVFFTTVESFIVGGCIGPKSVLERYLSEDEKLELQKMVHSEFDGSNAQQVLSAVNTYVHARISRDEWKSILPELTSYQARNHECSIYAQLLPKHMYKQLISSVWRANEMGASKLEVKRLVEDYVERVIKSGVIPDAPTQPQTPMSPLPQTPMPIVQPPSQLVTNTIIQPEQTMQPNQIAQPVLSGRYSMVHTRTGTQPRTLPNGSYNQFGSSYNKVPLTFSSRPSTPRPNKYPKPRYPTLVVLPESDQSDHYQSNNLPKSSSLPDPKPLFPLTRPSARQLAQYGRVSWNG